MKIVYFTSKTGNTARFVEKLQLPNIRITKGLVVSEPFILFVPTYASANGKGGVATPIIHFLNEEENRSNLKAIVGFGNRNFGMNFAIGAEIVSRKCNVPIIQKVELFGNQDDVEILRDRIKNYEY